MRSSRLSPSCGWRLSVGLQRFIALWTCWASSWKRWTNCYLIGRFRLQKERIAAKTFLKCYQSLTFSTTTNRVLTTAVWILTVATYQQIALGVEIALYRNESLWKRNPSLLNYCQYRRKSPMVFHLFLTRIFTRCFSFMHYNIHDWLANSSILKTCKTFAMSRIHHGNRVTFFGFPHFRLYIYLHAPRLIVQPEAWDDRHKRHIRTTNRYSI